MTALLDLNRKRRMHGSESTGTKSKFQKKMARKASGGAIDPRWMWWFVRTEAEAES